MSQLRLAFKGKAEDAVKAPILMSNNPRLVIDTLEQEFGRSEHIIRTLLEKARQAAHLIMGS